MNIRKSDNYSLPFLQQSKGALITIHSCVECPGWAQVWGSGIQCFDPPLEKDMLMQIMKIWFFVFSFDLIALVH